MSKLLNSLDPLPRATLSEQVAKQLAARITAGDWKPGEKRVSRVVFIGRNLKQDEISQGFLACAA